MGDGYYLKTFPVWFSRRGNYGVLLSQTKALSTAARLRQDKAATDLAQKQLEWIVGRNPFVQSTMWGEGYDFAQQYSVSSGDIAGSLPVGMMTRGDGDAPYWPPQNCYVYKEVWVHSSARWLWIMEDVLSFPSIRSTGFAVSQTTDSHGNIVIRLTAKGSGRHRFTLRTENLDVKHREKELDLEPGVEKTAEWKAQIQSPGAPWVSVVIPDDDLSRLKELER